MRKASNDLQHFDMCKNRIEFFLIHFKLKVFLLVRTSKPLDRFCAAEKLPYLNE